MGAGICDVGKEVFVNSIKCFILRSQTMHGIVY